MPWSSVELARRTLGCETLSRKVKCPSTCNSGKMDQRNPGLYSRFCLKNQNAPEFSIMWSWARGARGRQTLSRKAKCLRAQNSMEQDQRNPRPPGSIQKEQNTPEFGIVWSWARGTHDYRSLSKKVKCPNALYSVGLGQRNLRPPVSIQKSKMPQCNVFCGAGLEEPAAAGFCPEKQNAPMLCIL